MSVVLSEHSKKVLRQQVLEIRAEYRRERERWLAAQRDAQIAHERCQSLRDHIQSLQMDCGDATEIDPHHPEDDRDFTPIKGIPCADRACVLYRTIDGGCRVCGAPCL